MAKLVRLLISARQQMVIGIMLGIVFFAILVGGVFLFARQEARRSMASESHQVLQPFLLRTDSAAETFAALKLDVTAPACTPEFNAQLRRVAYRPDGFNEFFYAPKGVVECSVGMGRFNPPITLGQADMAARDGEPAMWVDRGLSFAGLNGLVGTVLHVDPFAIVLPLEKMRIDPPQWMEMEVVFAAPSGRWWHRGGQQRVYAAYKESLRQNNGSLGFTLHNSVCMPNGRVCVATAAPLAALLSHFLVYILVALVAAAALATWLAKIARIMIVSRWSFESRFRRHMDAGSVICVYQPIMDLQTGKISGCEVLARWRDVDDTVVHPDRFIPLVEKCGLTQKFTRMVVERAFAELSTTVPEDHKMTLTFNIFPCDLDSTFLCDVLKAFDAIPGRFDLVVEIVETNAIEVVGAQMQIEALRIAGIRTYIDDFGTGYSNIHNLAALAVDGVKLDRSFAMAAEGSVMARMLSHAIDMIHASGRPMVVEGVETAERLRLLRGILPPIDYVQGYYISRPLDIDAFTAFLLRHDKGFQRLELVA